MNLILNKEHFTFHLQYKHSDTFANRKYDDLSYPKNQKMCDPFDKTLLKMRAQGTGNQPWKGDPSTGTSQIAS